MERRSVQALLGDDLLMEVDPRKIRESVRTAYHRVIHAARFVLGDRFTKRFIERASWFPRVSFVWHGRWDRSAFPFESTYQFQLISDLYKHKLAYKQSRWYQLGLDTIRNGGEFRHKRICITNQPDLDRFFEEHPLKLLSSMERSGYEESKATSVPPVVIARDGRLLKINAGNHRLAAGQVVGLKRFPAEVRAVHGQWLNRINGGFQGETLEHLKRGLKAVEGNYR